MQTYEFTRSKDASIDDIITTYNRWGIVHIPNYLDSSTVGKMTEEFFQLIDGVDQWATPRFPYAAGKETRIEREGLNKSGRFPATQSVFSSPLMGEVSKRVFGPEHHLNYTIMIHQDLPNPQESITDIHYDRLSTLKFFIYLKDTTTANGAFECLPGSHTFTRRVRSHYLKRGVKLVDLPNENLPANFQQMTPIEGPAGTMFIFTTDLFHRGGVVSEGQERLVMRGHTHGKEVQVYKPKKYSSQWWRESAYNPLRYVYKVIDSVVTPAPPNTM